MSNDVAGATFMAAGTSAPELFTNIMGTFVTKSDLGIGTIVGSAVFNIFGVISVCGLFSGQRIPLDWYPISRDCFFYGLTVIVLFVVLVDEKVQWWEAMIMVICYSGYIILMALNVRIEKWSHQTVKSIKKRVYPQSSEDQSTPQIPMTTGPTPNESTPLHSATKSTQITVESPPVTSSGTQTLSHEDSVDGSITRINGVHPDGYLDNHDHDVEEEGDDPGYPWQAPQGVLAKIWWLCFFPTNLLFFLTIPDVRRPSCVNWFPVTFAMCMAWIGAISYEVTWLITVIGYTIRVPDTVMGLSFLAVGTSIPEVFSSLIVSKQVILKKLTNFKYFTSRVFRIFRVYRVFRIFQLKLIFHDFFEFSQLTEFFKFNDFFTIFFEISQFTEFFEFLPSFSNFTSLTIFISILGFITFTSFVTFVS